MAIKNQSTLVTSASRYSDIISPVNNPDGYASGMITDITDTLFDVSSSAASIVGGSDVSASWGNISGNINNQTDLINSLVGTSSFNAVSSSISSSLSEKSSLFSIDRTITGTTHTIERSDSGKVIYFTNAGAVTVTVPSSSFTDKVQCMLVKKGTGNVSVVTASGATLESSGSTVAIRYQAATLIHEGGNVYGLYGNLS